MKFLIRCQADIPSTEWIPKQEKKFRLKIHLHLAKYLKPEKPFSNLKDLQKAGYKF
jgi:hypothetical protein